MSVNHSFDVPPSYGQSEGGHQNHHWQSPPPAGNPLSTNEVPMVYQPTGNGPAQPAPVHQQPSYAPGYPSYPQHPPSNQQPASAPPGYSSYPPPPNHHQQHQQQQYNPPYNYPPPQAPQQNISMNNTTTVVVAQAAPTICMPIIVPRSFLGCAWLACLCFFPLGIPAIITSSQVDSAIAEGDYDRALKYSRRTKTLSYVAILLGILLSVGSGVVFGNRDSNG